MGNMYKSFGPNLAKELLSSIITNKAVCSTAYVLTSDQMAPIPTPVEIAQLLSPADTSCAGDYKCWAKGTSQINRAT